MSDVVRNYTGAGKTLRNGSRRRRSGGFLRKVLLPVLLILLVYVLWTTRDSYAITRCMPAGMKYSVVLADPMHGQERIADSRVWQALPPSWTGGEQRTNLVKDSGVPDWVLNNLFHERVYLLGNNLQDFSDVLALTHMTRIGVLLERFHRFMPSISDDFAGGLRLRKVASTGFYYAVRGRILLLSPSRDALIHALTIARENAIDDKTLADLTQSGTEDLRGTLTLGPDDPLGSVFQSLAFALRIDTDEAHAKCRGILRPEARARFAPLISHATPTTLLSPPEGMVEVSANFGKPFHEVWTGLGKIADWPLLSEEKWAAWQTSPEAGAPGFGPLFTGLLGDKGPGIRVSLVGADLNEIVPMPLVACTVDADVAAIPALFKALPPPPPDIMPWDPYPRYDADSGVVSVLMPGGPSLEPSACVYGRSLLVSTSFNVAKAMATGGGQESALPAKGNLFLRVRPQPLVESAINAGEQLLAFNGLRGYTPDTFAQASAQWRASAQVVSELSGLASVEGGELDVELEVTCSTPK